MARIAWTHEALIELNLIRLYIEQFDPAAAERMAHKLDAAASGLQDFPNRGRPLANGQRELPAVPPYLIRYRVDGDWVFITEIVHSASERD